MSDKPTYKELELQVKELEEKATEFKQNDKTLLESEERFRLLYERAPLGYQSLDENGHFLEINKAWLDTLGFTRDEVIGKSFADFLLPDWKDHFKENFPRFKALGEILGVEFEMVKKDGSIIMVTFNGKIGKHSNGSFKQTHCILHDITEEKKDENKLRENERKLRRLIESTDTVPWELDLASGKFSFMGQQIETILGYPVDSWVDMDNWISSCAWNREKSWRSCSRIQRTGERNFLSCLSAPSGHRG